MSRTNAFQAVLVGGLLLAVAGCADQPGSDSPDAAVFADGAANHPISVEPSPRSIRIALAERGIAPADELPLSSFVSDYLENGNGSISISAPRGAYSQPGVEELTERLVRMGVPRSRILVGTGESPAYDGQVELSYLSYGAHTDACSNWSDDADKTVDNLPMPDFGCATQHNMAAMVADPRDLVQARPMGPADATRRQTILQTYEKGAVTAAQKTEEQKSSVSDVASGQ